MRARAISAYYLHSTTTTTTKTVTTTITTTAETTTTITTTGTTLRYYTTITRTTTTITNGKRHPTTTTTMDVPAGHWYAAVRGDPKQSLEKTTTKLLRVRRWVRIAPDGGESVFYARLRPDIHAGRARFSGYRRPTLPPPQR